jgi:hypothetical protein
MCDRVRITFASIHGFGDRTIECAQSVMGHESISVMLQGYTFKFLEELPVLVQHTIASMT